MPFPVRTVVVSAWLAATLAVAPVAHGQEHVVQPGETLWQIALASGVDSGTLLKLNGIADGDVLQAGQTLKLSASSASSVAPSGATYTVAEGDTLSAIALQLNVSATTLIEANKLEDPNRLSVGAQLVVPGGSAARPSTAPAPSAPAPAQAAPTPAAARGIVTAYTVQSGETLSQIARQLDVSADAIAQANGIDDPNRIAVGTVLKVPLPGAEHTVQDGETLRDIALRSKTDLGLLIDFNDLDDPELIRVGQVIMIPASGSQRAASVQPPPQPAAPPKPTATATPKPAATPTPAPSPKPAAPAPTAKPIQPPSPNSDGIVANAMKLRGTPYVWGGSGPSGFDCSGYVWYVARQSGKQMSRGLMGQYNSGSHPARTELKPGDLVFFQNTYAPGVSHNGVFIGNDQFIHAADEGAGVTVSSLSSAYWSGHWFGATRLP